MAKQHFYSRVPARMAMFHRSDSFDTFACSKDIDRNFIEKDMQVILDQKLSNDELGLVRTDTLPPLYAHYYTKDGKLVESCVTYIPLDYTNERSSYLVHSLIFDEEEIEVIHNTFNSIVIPKTMFVHSLKGFDITAPDGKPNRNYREKAFTPKNLPQSIKWLQTDFDQNTMKQLIFALVGAVCGKYKNVFIIMPNNDFDEKANLFFNSIIQIFPYNVRKNLSYVSRCGDFNKFPGIKFKFIPESLGVAPQSKGVTIDLKNKLVFGIKENDLVNNGFIADFFYNLIGNQEFRREFQLYSFRIMRNEKLSELTLKAIGELVFLFRASCGLYEENKVLPNNDKVYEFICCYEKYRFSLTDEYRMTGIRCLKRYYKIYEAIPKNIFSKITKMYESEIPGTKYIIMDVAIEMIHTDLMRQQLFNFIKGAYKKENEDMKKSIIEAFSQVLYGGFLQPQIIAFYDQHFDDMEEKLRTEIFEKMLLAIRTDIVQEPLLQFVDDHYQSLTNVEKEMFYRSLTEQLNENDELARKYLKIMDSFLEGETNKIRDLYSDIIKDLYANNTNSTNKMLIAAISASSGFTSTIITRCVYAKWRGKKNVKELVQMLCSGTLSDRVSKVLTMWTDAYLDIREDWLLKLLKQLLVGYTDNSVNTTVQEILDCQEYASQFLSMKKYDDSRELLYGELLNPLFDMNYEQALIRVFEVKEQNYIESILEKLPMDKISNVKGFSTIENYLLLKDTIKSGDIGKGVLPLVSLVQVNDYRKRISAYMTSDLGNIDFSIEGKILYSTAIILLKTLNYGFEETYYSNVKLIEEKYGPKESSKVKEEITKVFNAILTIVKLVYVSELKDDLRKLVIDASSGFGEGVKALTYEYGLRYVKEIIEKDKSIDKEVVDYVMTMGKSVKPKSVFDKLFKKR